ncbi:hypothetical protein HY839_01930 [Candidatus Azambacteria bacterium]|nr:hypothetical protein [Candidatus Azambacteria bacterium]
MERGIDSHVKDMSGVCISGPVQKIITQATAKIKNGDSLSMKHDHWVDQPSHDHYRDASTK